MAKRSARSYDEEVSEKSELRCMWSGLFSVVLGSCQVHAGPYKLFSNRKPAKTSLTADNSRKLDQLAGLDKDCRENRIEEANLAINASEKSVRNLILDDIYNDRRNNKQIKVKAVQQLIAKTRKNKSQKANQTSSNADRLLIHHHHQQPSTPRQDHDEIVRQAKMSIKAFIDQMFVDGKMTSTESMPFSDALQVLSTQETVDSRCSTKQSQPKSDNDEKPTPFSAREIRQKLKHTFGESRKSGKEIDMACLNETERKKLDFSNLRFSKKHVPDTASETKRRHMMSVRLKRLNAMGAETSKRLPKTIRTVLPSTEQEMSILSPGRDIKYCSCSARTRSSPYSSNFLARNERQRTYLSSPLRTTVTDVISCDDYEDFDDTTDCFSPETIYEACDGEPQRVGTESPVNTTETSISFHDLDMSESINYQEKHQSPVSFLDQFFTEDADNSNSSPSNIMLQTEGNRSQLRCIYSEDLLIESSPQDRPVSEIYCNDEQDHISKYVHIVWRKASCLNWDQLSRISSPSKELLPSSVYDEVEFLQSDCHLDKKLLFDHMKEVLLQVHRSRFSFPTCPSSVKLENSNVLLEELVLGEIMRKADEFYLLPPTEERTVDQIVANDVSDSKPWTDAREEGEHITVHIAEDILEEAVLDIVLGLHS
ncbi:hypothetical protein OROGR_012984 [Orobanche gracilis]